MAGLEQIASVMDKMSRKPTYEKYIATKKSVLSAIDTKEEYVQGGAIFCKKCGRIKSFDDPAHSIFLNCKCECVIQKEEEREKIEYRRQIVNRFKHLNFNELGEKYRRAKFSGLDVRNVTEEFLEVAERCEKFCDNFKQVLKSGHGIWLYGDSGVGKTHLAACIMNRLENMYFYSCIFTTLDKLMSSIKATYSYQTANTEENYLQAISSCDLLILDDLGSMRKFGNTEKGSFAVDKLSDIISRRYENHRPIVITSNKSIEDMAADNELPKRICDRLIERQVVLHVTGESRRKCGVRNIEF